jgi:hypothetical protein
MEHADRAAPEQKALRLLTDAEKVQIIHMRKGEYSRTTISSILKPPASTYRSFYEKQEQTDVSSRARRHPRRILQDVKDRKSVV